MRARCNSDGGLVIGGEGKRRDKSSGSRRKPLLLGLFLVVALGTVVYFRLWSIDYQISTNEAELLRRQFDLANREAMDESAEWRLKFDGEREKAARCAINLKQIKESHQNSAEKENLTKKLEMLQRENIDLLERLETMKQELETEKLKCSKL